MAFTGSLGASLDRCEPQSSTRTDAAAALPTLLRGRVVHGDQRGRIIGFPTANLAVDESELGLVHDGVFAGWFAVAGGHPWPSAVSIGRRPTFYQDRGLRLVEVHLLDFDGDLYDLAGELALVAHVRDQQAFASMAELTAQLVDDIATVRLVLLRGAVITRTTPRPDGA